MPPLRSPHGFTDHPSACPDETSTASVSDGLSYQVRVFNGMDSLTGEKVYVTGSALTEKDAIRLRDRLRRDVADSRTSRTNGTLAHRREVLCRTPSLPTALRRPAVQWDWIGVNPLDMTSKPRAPKPQPSPPGAVNAARIIEKAWSADAEWGTFVWLTMVTGARRGELVALRFSSVELSCGECSRPVD